MRAGWIAFDDQSRSAPFGMQDEAGGGGLPRLIQRLCQEPETVEDPAILRSVIIDRAACRLAKVPAPPASRLIQRRDAHQFAAEAAVPAGLHGTVGRS